jgi:hypothetical protein
MPVKDHRSIAERLWDWIEPEPNSGCWLWTGGQEDGYGRLAIGSRPVRTHRLAWREWRGPIPKGAWVLHRCDVRACVNPDHLFLGTLKDNFADMRSKGRHARGERHMAAKLTESSVRAIRQLAGSMSTSAIARQFGVSHDAASYIIRRKTWKSVR